MMDFDEIIVKESPGLCRCCLSEGCYKDLSTEYSWMSDTEIYADMLLECFDISISQHIEGPNGPNRLICEVCITRLRDACNFKKQVLDSEKKFVDMLGRGEFQPKVVIYETPLKNEEMVEETLAEDVEVEYLEDDMDFGDDLPLRPATVEPSISNITVDALKVKGKRGRPKKSTAIKTEKKAKVPKLDDKPRTSKAVSKGKRTIKEEIKFEMGQEYDDVDEADVDDSILYQEQSSTSKRQVIMRQNVLQILLKSTVMPFRWLISSYRCFYCYDIFADGEELKDHNKLHTEVSEKCEAMKKFLEPTVYVDVSNISCKLCSKNIKDLNQLIDHLIYEHDVAFNKDIGICMNAFKLYKVSVKCTECDTSFKTFSQLLIHTNKNHKGTADILCDHCGQYFRTRRELTLHIRKTHENIPIKCSQCDVILKRTQLRTHMQRFHDKRYKCKSCLETFDTYYTRLSHMMKVHNHRTTVTCLACPRTFVFRSAMMKHYRETHLQEKNAVCNICGFESFNVQRLQRHVMKHSNERNVKCTACEKAFKTRKTMLQHFRNIHEKTSKEDVLAEAMYLDQML